MENGSRSCIRSMQTVDSNEIGAQVRATLHNRSESLWMPGLAERLAEVAWNQLEHDIGMTHSSYGTARVFHRNPEGVHLVVAQCTGGSSRGAVGEGGIAIEILPPDTARQIAGNEVVFLDGHQVVGTIVDQLDEALSLISLVPTVWPTIWTLVRSLHIIDPGGDDTDVSFSDPDLPFSVFVSVPRTWSEVAALRVAEAVLHEAMHLQLTLVERVVTLVLPQRSTYYSPWRDEQRSSEGILQALYTFSVIRSFLRVIPLPRRPNPVSDHVASRIEQIGCQIEQAQVFRECDELTPDGAALVARLLDTAY